MIFPIREVLDVILAQFNGQIFSAVGIKAFPGLNLLKINEPDWEKLTTIFFRSTFLARRISVITHSLFMLFSERTNNSLS